LLFSPSDDQKINSIAYFYRNPKEEKGNDPPGFGLSFMKQSCNHGK